MHFKFLLLLTIYGFVTSAQAQRRTTNNSLVTKADANTLISTANATFAPLASPTFTGTVSGITASMVGLGNVNNTSDASKPVSTATQTALDLKQNVSGNTGGWTELRVSGSNSTTTGQSLVDITGLVTGTLPNATKYEIEIVLDASTSNVTTGTQYGIATGGTGGASVVIATCTGTTTAVAGTTTTINTAATATAAFLTASSISGVIVIKGYVTTRGSGTANISIQHLKVTSGTSTVKIGSVFRYRLAQ